MILYPLAIVLILLTLCSPLFSNKHSVYAASMLLTFFVSFFDGYSTLAANLPYVTVSLFDSIKAFYMDYLPLYNIGLGWIIPALIGTTIGYFWPKGDMKKS
jgi:LIVCS family branched-chain amino acid:cation transporter